MDFEIHCMFILPTELSFFNYDKVKSVSQSIAPLKQITREVSNHDHKSCRVINIHSISEQLE